MSLETARSPRTLSRGWMPLVDVTGRAEVAQMLEDAGPGARGIVFGGRAGRVGHVFNAVNQGGTIRFLDPQIGGPASFSGYDSFRFLWTAQP